MLVLTALTPSSYAAEMIVENAPDSIYPGCEEDNGCFLPAQVRIDVGDTVTWVNDYPGAHTATAGSVQEGPSEIFDSGLIMTGSSFSFTFNEAGEYPYYCLIHEWMTGVVIVGQEMGEPSIDEILEAEPMMVGVILGLDIDPPLPFDPPTQSMLTLSFTPRSTELEGSTSPEKIDHLDYVIIITKDGNEVWKSDILHDNDGNLELQVTPSEGSFTITGGEDMEGQSSTGPYMLTGPVFMDKGNYLVSAQIVGIEFNSLPTPLTDDFSIQVIPEFGSLAMIILAVGVVSIIAVTAKSRLVPKL